MSERMVARSLRLLALLAGLLFPCCGSKPMDETSFWRLIEDCGSPCEPRQKEEALRHSLRRLSPEDLVTFDRIYHEKMRRAYTWDLWAAGFIIGGGCSDDGFTEFRNFVIGHGGKFYEAAVANPDSMAETLENVPEPRGMRMPYLPESDMIAAEIYLETTGTELPFESSRAGEPAGTRWTEGRADLSRICPKLWARFGGEWIERFEHANR